MEIKRKNVDKLLSQICENIGGDWVLLGGALAVLSFNSARMTEDMGLFHRDKPKDPTQLRLLFEQGRTLGLNEEQLNSAASFFFQEIPNWNDELILLKEQNKGRIWRPSLTAIIFMKIKRFSPIDIQDIDDAIKTYGINEFSINKFKKWSDQVLTQKLKSKFPKLLPDD